MRSCRLLAGLLTVGLLTACLPAPALSAGVLPAVPGAAALGAVPAPPARPLPAAERILRTLLAAPALVDYEGTKVISTVRGARAETVTMLESYKRLGRLRLEFLSPESVSGRLIVDDGLSLWQYEPSLHLVIRVPSFVQGRARPERAAEILRRHRVAVLGREPVIGRETVVLEIDPGTEGARRLWVDEATGVVLRTEERDARGEIVYVSYFTRISYSLNLPLALFRFRQPAGSRTLSFHISGQPITSLAELRRRAGTDLAFPTRLLGLEFREGRIAEHGALTTAAATYTDGVSTVTLFQTPTARMAFPEVGAPVALRGARARMLDLGYFRVLLWQARGMNYAAVGNVPPGVLLAIAEAVGAGR